MISQTTSNRNLMTGRKFPKLFLGMLTSMLQLETQFHEFFRQIKFKASHSAHCGNYGNSLSLIFGKFFVKLAILLNKLLKSWFDETFFWWERIYRLSTQCFRTNFSVKMKRKIEMIQFNGFLKKKLFNLIKSLISIQPIFPWNW